MRLPAGTPRATGSFTEPRRGALSCPAECEPGGKSVARAAICRRGGRALAGLLGSAVLALAPAFDCEAQSRIGRLFSTAEQRIALDRLRDRPAVEQVVVTAALEPEPEPEPEPELALDPEAGRDAPGLAVTVNGVVLRSDGHRLAWVDGVEAGDGATTPGGAGIEVDRAPGGRVRIRLPERGVHADLKPGQTIDVARGSVFEAYESRPVKDTVGTSGARAPEPDRPESDARTSPNPTSKAP